MRGHPCKGKDEGTGPFRALGAPRRPGRGPQAPPWQDTPRVPSAQALGWLPQQPQAPGCTCSHL